MNARRPSRRCIGALACLIMAPAGATTFSVLNMDTGTTGLNDTTAFTPVGGNTATTLGQARLNVIAEAGRQWGLRVSSPQTIVIEAKMAPDTCTSSSGTLATAGPRTYFTTASAPNVLLPAALSHALHGPDANNRSDVSLSINSTVGTGSGCLNGRSFYLGLDHAPGSSIDLLNVLLHEVGHGLGFVSLTDQSGAPLVAGKFTVFDQHMYSETLGRYWPSMTDAERATASTASGTLVFNGPSVNSHLGSLTAGLSTGAHLRLYAPTTWSDGSSLSHWDTIATPNLLLEPFITANPQGLTDLTGCVLVDIGWPSARCPDSATAANTPPVAVAQTVSVAGDTPTAITLRGNDPDSPTLTYSIVGPPTRGTLTAPASLSGTGGVVFTYTASSNQSFTDSFTFQVTDGTSTSAPATVTLTVTAINHAPVANAQAVTAYVGQATAITLAGSDPDGSAITYSLVPGSGPTSGTLSGTPPGVSYTPNAGFIGSDSFQFRVNDGQLNSAPATVTLAVLAINHAPVAIAQSLTTIAGQATPITLTGSDADGNAITYSVIADPTSGTLSGTPPSVSYTSSAGFVGNDSFQFRVNDGQLNSAAATISLSITAAPAAVVTASGGGSSGGGGTDGTMLLILASLLLQSSARSGTLRRFGARFSGRH